MYKIEVIGTYSFELPFKDAYGARRSIRIDADEGFILDSEFDEFKDSILQEARKYQAAGLLIVTELKETSVRKKEPEIPFKGSTVTEKKVNTSSTTKQKQTNNTTRKSQEKADKKPAQQEPKQDVKITQQPEGEK